MMLLMSIGYEPPFSMRYHRSVSPLTNGLPMSTMNKPTNIRINSDELALMLVDAFRKRHPELEDDEFEVDIRFDNPPFAVADVIIDPST